jgi:hypothetical protein
MSSVKRLLRDRNTRKFFKQGDWIDDADEASSFDSVLDALHVGRSIGGDAVEVVLRFTEAGREMSFPVIDGDPTPPASDGPRIQG